MVRSRILLLTLALTLGAGSPGFGAEGAPEQRSARTDCYGDPLPPGALARMGTVRLRAHAVQRFDFAFSPDGKVLAAAADGTVRFWDTATGKLRWKLAVQDLTGPLRYSPDGGWLAAGLLGRVVGLIDPATGRVVRSLQADLTSVGAFSPDGKLLATDGRGGPVVLWETATGKEVRRLHSPGLSLDVTAFTPDGRTLVTMGSDVCRWDVGTGRLNWPFVPDGIVVRRISLAPDGETLAVLPWRNEPVRLWDTATGKERCRLPRMNTLPSFGLVFTPDGRAVATAAEGPGGDEVTVSLWDCRTGRPLRRLVVPRRWAVFRAILPLFAPDGRTLLLAPPGSAPGLWDTATGRRLLERDAHDGEVTALAFTPDGRRLVSGSADGTARLWDAGTGRPLRVLAGHRGGVNCVAVLPDGKALLSGGADGTLCLQELPAGKEIRRRAIDAAAGGIDGSPVQIQVLSLADDGRTAASAGCTDWGPPGWSRSGTWPRARPSCAGRTPPGCFCTCSPPTRRCCWATRCSLCRGSGRSTSRKPPRGRRSSRRRRRAGRCWVCPSPTGMATSRRSRRTAGRW
jgi:WD40 repeat protein